MVRGFLWQLTAKISKATRSAAMSHIEPRLTSILGRATMRMKLLKIVVVLLLAGSGDARPQKTEETVQSEVSLSSNEGWKAVQPLNASGDVRKDSSVPVNDTHRHLKDLQYMDQSLRTVATQLLNVTSPEDTSKIVDKDTLSKPTPQKQDTKNEASLIKEINSEISNLESMGVGFGRPINSKFGYFESSHPGQAMALTEEELEREMSSTRLITAYKNQPTTTGGISTWILLNPPSTTAKTMGNDKKTKYPVETEGRITIKPTATMERVQLTEKVTEKLTSPVPTAIFSEVVTSSTKKPLVTTRKPAIDSKPEKPVSSNKSEPLPSTTSKVSHVTAVTSSADKDVASTASITKKVQIVRTTPKPKITMLSKPSTLKTSRPNQQTRPKPSTRRTTVKPDIKNENVSTAKIEKVTFKPMQMITIQKIKNENTERPMFVTKIKASVLMDTQKATTVLPDAPTLNSITSSTMKSNLSSGDLVEVPVKSKPSGTKVNNVLKVQLKKPLDESTKIEIEPIKVNAPVLKIQKVENKDDKKAEEIEKETEMLDNSRIDLEFDFNPELTKINVETSTETTSTTTTTKRPRQNSKRKKNKLRRRKPSTTMSPTSTTASTVMHVSSTENEPLTDIILPDVGIQESKIAPETKIAKNSTKTKDKQPQKPISTQIYNFLSREVMPSFGVMSLVGLGLGLASYFLYPFGGTISRRNYEIEPKYKYNLDEYGGNYGQSEEEVLAKVLQGMITDDSKYPGTKDYDNNYPYQHYDSAYDSQSTRKSDQRYTSSPVYRAENTASVLKYRNTGYRYSDMSSTPKYYDKSKHPEYVIHPDVLDSANRQFVVGNVPKEYPPYNEKIPTLSTAKIPNGNYEATESNQFNYPLNSMKVQNYGHPEIQTLRTDDGYEEIEITPTAVAVEHGPRALKTKRSLADNKLTSLGENSIDDDLSLREDQSSRNVRPIAHGEVHLLRTRRDSVIQVIPSKKELEEEEKEENLSNEILDIIDSALPGEDEEKMKNRREENEVEDLNWQNRKKQEEEKTRLKESTMKTLSVETSTSSMDLESSSHESTSSATKDVMGSDSLNSSSSSESSSDADSNKGTTTNPKTTEENTVEWIDLTTKRPSEENGFNLFSFVKKVAEIKFRLGLTLLKHASEGFARYLGHVQKRINGEE